MFDIKVLGSGSKGNCYRVTDGHTQVLLDAGLPVREIQKGLDFRLTDIQGVLISHEHMDHGKAAKDMMRRGIAVYGSRGTLQALDLDRGRKVEVGRKFEIGTMEVLPFDLVHDAAEPLGFLIYSTATKGKLVYITDTQYCPYDFRDLTHIMIEINYSDDELAKNVAEGRILETLAKRIARNHMGLNEGTEFLKRHAGPNLRGVWILHMSDGNSNEEEIRRQAQRATGVPVTIC